MMEQCDLDFISKWLKESPRNRALEILIVLVSLFWFLQLWLIERIIKLRSRSRHAPDVVGSKRGGSNDDDAIAEPKPSVSGHEFSPPQKDRPIPFPATIGETRNPMLAVRRRRE